MKLGVHIHISEPSLSDTISVPDGSGVQCSRKAVHDWVQKADLRLDGSGGPNQVAVDESVIRINDQQFRLYAVIDPTRTTFSIFGSLLRTQPS
jgi:transposase-like protein